MSVTWTWVSAVEGCPLPSFPPSLPSSQPDSHKEGGESQEGKREEGQLSSVPLEYFCTHLATGSGKEGMKENRKEVQWTPVIIILSMHAGTLYSISRIFYYTHQAICLFAYPRVGH